jgi:ElaB/YqjD/DUF883 family membrane-anchored ribosome-binding protein
MTNSNLGSEQSPRQRGDSDAAKNAGKMASDAFSKTSEFARQTADSAKHAASDGASGVAGQMREYLDRKVHGSGEMVGHFADSARHAAGDMEQDSPEIANMVRSFAGRVDTYADSLREQSAEDVMHTMSDFTRRQPMLVFGVTAAAGFLLFRTLKSAPSKGSRYGEENPRGAADGA